MTERKAVCVQGLMPLLLLLAAAATGSAQSMKAEIPFRFDAGGAHMQPGSYQVRLNHTNPFISRSLLLATMPSGS